jgi:nucleoside-diphosphate-sugar epimerase
MNLHASAAGLRCLKRKIPFRLAHASFAALEALYRAAQRVDEPYCTRIALAFAANDFNIDCSLAKRDLSWKGEASYKEAIFRAVEWILRFG